MSDRASEAESTREERARSGKAESRSRSLRIAVDGTSLLGTRTGVGHFTAQLVDALDARGDLDLAVFAVTWRGRRDLGATLPARADPATAPVPARLARLLWPRVGFPRVERWTGPVDLVHATNYVAPPARVPVVVTVHDLGFARFPELCTGDARSYARLVRVALDRGATVHVVSDFVGGEVRDEFALDPTRIVRVYPGLRVADGGDPGAGRALAGADRYVLALGTVEPRKNLPALVRAFDRVAGSHPGLRLVVAGPDGWDRDAFAAAWASARHGDRVQRLGYVTEDTRADLLAGAAAFAYPSLYEGFGHPPLEAMTAGVPVVAARTGSLPEVLGDAALLVEPDDLDDLAAAIDAALSDVELRTRLATRGRDQAARFSWGHAADDFARLYRSLV